MKLTLATMFDAHPFGSRNAMPRGDLRPGRLEENSRSLDAAIQAQRPSLVRCAIWLLGDRLAAQRLVEGALAGAAEAPSWPQGFAALRRWLFGLVKRSVVRALRHELRAVPLRDDSHEDGGDGAPAFRADGHWCSEPTAWGDAQAALAEAGFQATLERCIDRLPANTARLYTMREILGMDTQEICDTLGLQQDVCASMLCRARLAVHQRLQQEWFAARSAA